MKWFKMLWLNEREKKAIKDAELKIKAPYKNVFYSMGTLTVVFHDGTVISKSDADVDLFDNVKAAITEYQIRLLMKCESADKTNYKYETKEDTEIISRNLNVLKDRDDFVIKGIEVYLKGVNLPLPAPVTASFIEILEKGYGDDKLNALKMFWLNLALNSLDQSREDLLSFVARNDVKITKNGNLVLYRRIVSKEGADKQFVAFISQSYYKVKKDGKDPRNFAIANTGDDYILIDLESYDGTGIKPDVNLQLAYLELPNYETNVFTASHDRSMTIKLGGIYKIDDNKINLNNGLCAAGGLHAAAVDYDYSGFGDTPVVVLVNPSKAITVPVNDWKKLRTTEMFIACVNDKPKGQHFDEDALTAFDEEYHQLTISELEEAVKNKSFQKISIQDKLPAVSLVDLNFIKEMLKQRVEVV